MTYQTAIQKIEEKLTSIPPSSRKALYKKLDIGFSEKISFYQENSRAFASGKIDLETSQMIYNKLNQYETTTLAERIVITEVITSVLNERLTK